MRTPATTFRFTPAELAAMDELVRRDGYRNRSDLLRALVRLAKDGVDRDKRQAAARASQLTRPIPRGRCTRSEVEAALVKQWHVPDNRALIASALIDAGVATEDPDAAEKAAE